MDGFFLKLPLIFKRKNQEMCFQSGDRGMLLS